MDTGFGKIDAMLKGLRPGGYYLIGGRPAMGKSALAINIAMHVAVKEQKNVAYFTMNLLKEHIKHRMDLIETNAKEEELCRNLIIDDTAFCR